MLGHIEMDEAAPMMGEHDQYEEHLESDRWYDKEVDGHQISHMVFQKAFQDGEGGLVGCTRYLSTVDWATLIPSFLSSPTIRGEPHPGLALEIRRIRTLISLETMGRPDFPLWLSLRQ
jgi:hypothetical protein